MKISLFEYSLECKGKGNAAWRQKEAEDGVNAASPLVNDRSQLDKSLLPDYARQTTFKISQTADAKDTAVPGSTVVTSKLDANYRKWQTRIYNFLERPRGIRAISYHLVV